ATRDHGGRVATTVGTHGVPGPRDRGGAAHQVRQGGVGAPGRGDQPRRAGVFTGGHRPRRVRGGATPDPPLDLPPGRHPLRRRLRGGTREPALPRDPALGIAARGETPRLPRPHQRPGAPSLAKGESSYLTTPSATAAAATAAATAGATFGSSGLGTIASRPSA